MRECEYYQELMSRLLDGALSEEEEAALREHVRTCPACLRMFSAFTGMTTALREDLAEPPKDLAQGVMARIADEERPAPRRRKAGHPSGRPRTWVRWAAAACLALAVAGIAAVAARQNRANSSQALDAGLRSAADTAQAEASGAADAGYGGDQPMPASLEGQAPAEESQDVSGAVSQDAAAAGIPTPSPSLEPLTVYDAARNRIGTIDPANIPAFQALISDEGWAEGRFEYMLRVEYLHKTYAFASDDDGGLIWWEEPSTQPLRSPGTFAQLHELITMESPALPQ